MMRRIAVAAHRDLDVALHLVPAVRVDQVDGNDAGWLVLPEAGTYRVRVACGEEHATTVEVEGRPFAGEPGFAHLQEVRVGR